MPDIDGFETAELIRQYKRSAHTPIIFVTSYADEMQTIRGYSLGAVDYILSPVDAGHPALEGEGLRRPAPDAAAPAPARQRAGRARRRRGGAPVAEENTRRSNFLSHAGRVLGCVARLRGAATPAARDARAAIRAASDARALRPERAASTSSSTAGSSAAGRAARAAARASSSCAADEMALLMNVVDPVAANVLAPASVGSPFVVLPLSTADRIVGAIRLRPATAPTGPASSELIDRSAIALENARLYRSLADRDRRAARRRGAAADVEPAQGRVPGDALARAAQSAGADPHRARGDPPARAGRAEADLGDRRHAAGRSAT